MNSWELIFRQSKANSGDYYGDFLAVQNWEWPQGTWLQQRLRRLRAENGRPPREATEAEGMPVQ
jgi:hypothetical protein